MRPVSTTNPEADEHDGDAVLASIGPIWAFSQFVDWNAENRRSAVRAGAPSSGRDRGMAPIEDYELLGDLQTCALVSKTGSIDWLCLPRFDSPACFAALLDSPDAGHWQIAPAAAGDRACTSRRYVQDTLVLQTDWQTPEGTLPARITVGSPPYRIETL